jgi:hypothetical protein
VKSTVQLHSHFEMRMEDNLAAGISSEEARPDARLLWESAVGRRGFLAWTWN